jgi:hypothetical protein
MENWGKIGKSPVRIAEILAKFDPYRYANPLVFGFIFKGS